MEILHMLFEMTESGLDKVVEHLLETEVRETQIIVFYIMLVFILILAYLCFIFFRRLYNNFIASWNLDWVMFKSELLVDWQGLSTAHKTYWIGGLLLINFLVFFFLM